MAILLLSGALAIAASAAGPEAPLTPLPAQPASTPWPVDAWPAAPDPAVAAAIAPAFEGARPEALSQVHAIAVIRGGTLIAERYGEGIGPMTPLPSWSMAKSVLHAAVGVLVREGRLDPAAPAPVPAWQAPDDPRHAITLDDLLHMRSGLDFAEDYRDAASSPVLAMLFGRGRDDMAAFAADTGLLHPPGTHWAYSSGTSNIVSGIVAREIGGGRDAYRAYLERELFAPLGIRSAQPEFDRAGTWIGSSFIHMTPRDFARFGLLYLRGGVWDGRRILPAGWADHARTPTPGSHGRYGAHFWLNSPDPGTGEQPFPGLPGDLFMARGYGGQVVAMLPSHDVVIVFLSATFTENVAPIIALFENVVTATGPALPRRPAP